MLRPAAALFAVLAYSSPAAAQYSDADCYPHLETPSAAQPAAKRIRGGEMGTRTPKRLSTPAAASLTSPFGVKIPVSRSLDGLPAPLVAKVRQLERECGSRVISTFRPGARVRGSGRISLHALRKAADLAGNPGCMRSKLAGWPGGKSVDYGAVGHFHISYDPGGREWGRRFSHWRPKVRYTAAK